MILSLIRLRSIPPNACHEVLSDGKATRAGPFSILRFMSKYNIENGVESNEHDADTKIVILKP